MVPLQHVTGACQVTSAASLWKRLNQFYFIRLNCLLLCGKINMRLKALHKPFWPESPHPVVSCQGVQFKSKRRFRDGYGEPQHRIVAACPVSPLYPHQCLSRCPGINYNRHLPQVNSHQDPGYKSKILDIRNLNPQKMQKVYPPWLFLCLHLSELFLLCMRDQGKILVTPFKNG